MAAAVLRSKADPRQKGEDLLVIARALDDVDLELPPRRAQVRRATLITSADPLDPHLSVVIGYLLSLLTIDRIEAVDVVFTCEFSASALKGPPEGERARMEAAFGAALARHRALCGGHVGESDLARVRVLVRPTFEELAEAIGDIVVRFEGASTHFSTWLAGRAIHRQRPVLTATYSSAVQRGRNSDLTLVRGEPTSAHQVMFAPAIAVPAAGPVAAMATESRNLLTVYGQNRLVMAMGALRAPEWAGLLRYFQRHPGATWHLVGAERPDLVVPRIPPSVLSGISGNIRVHGRADLAGFFQDAAAFLPLPRVFGGALGALQAIRAGCPVVGMVDGDSDISNFIPAHLQFPTLEAALQRAASFPEEPDARARLLTAQREHLDHLSDFTTKGAELWAALCVADAAWERHAAMGQQPRPASAPGLRG